MNVKIGAEAAQFPEKEYINEIAVAVHNTTDQVQVGVYIWALQVVAQHLLAIEKFSTPPHT
jgi:hypothetical protein